MHTTGEIQFPHISTNLPLHHFWPSSPPKEPQTCPDMKRSLFSTLRLCSLVFLFFLFSPGGVAVDFSHLAVAYNNDRTFVVRGKNMGVFRADDEGVKFQTLVKLKDQKQKGFAPSQVLLHEQDHSMLFLNPEENSKVSQPRGASCAESPSKQHAKNASALLAVQTPFEFRCESPRDGARIDAVETSDACTRTAPLPPPPRRPHKNKASTLCGRPVLWKMILGVQNGP